MKLFDRSTKAGFTLVELIVVIAILAILAGIAIPVYSGYIKKAEKAADLMLLDTLNTAYAAACTENGEYDMKNLSFAPTASLSSGRVTMGKFNEDFQRYFAGNGTFKYYEVLGFKKDLGVFVGTTEAALVEALVAIWSGSSFASEDGSVEAELLSQFDSISDLFSTYGNLLSLAIPAIKESVPELAPLVTGLGLDGLAAAADMSDEDIAAYLSEHMDGFNELSDDEKLDKINQYRNNVRGNAAVAFVANDATGRTVSDVQNSLGSLMDVFKAGAAELTDERAEAMMLSQMNDDEKAAYNAMSAEQKAEVLAGAKESLNEVVLEMGDTKITNAGMLSIMEAAGSATGLESGGVSSLGALYALTTGYYNNPTYFTGEKPETTGGSAKLASVIGAISDPGFQAYYNAQGATDIAAYLDAMSVLDAHSDSIDMTSDSAYADQYEFLAEILGITTGDSVEDGGE